MKIFSISKVVGGMQSSLARDLKNSENDKSALQYELGRMQHLDRIKVRHAKDKFLNPDTKTMLPSLDTAYASVSMGMSMTPGPLIGGREGEFNMGAMSEKDIITSSEIHGHCEKFGKNERIIIARSTDPGMASSVQHSKSKVPDLNTERHQLGSLDNKMMENKLNETYHFKNGD